MSLREVARPQPLRLRRCGCGRRGAAMRYAAAALLGGGGTPVRQVVGTFYS